MKARRKEPTTSVRYLCDAAGIKAGVEKSLPLSLAAQMVALGICEYPEDVKAPAKEHKPEVKTKELKAKVKTKAK